MAEQGSTLSTPGLYRAAVEPDTVRLTFRQLYDSYFTFVWRAVANRGVPAAAMDDVVQEVFLVVHRKLGEFEGRSTVRTWLSAIVRRVVSDHVKKRGNQATAQETLQDHPICSDEDPAADLERRAAAELVDRLLEKMSEVQ